MNFPKVCVSILTMALSSAVIPGAEAATNLITNGGFEDATYTSNHQFGSGWNNFGGQGVDGWTGGSGFQMYLIGGTQSTTNIVDAFGDTNARFYPSMNTLSPDGGNFIALDGDVTVPSGSISQTLSNLVVGQNYVLKFFWGAGQLANRSGATTEQLKVSFGDQTQSTNILSIPSGGFSGWKEVSMNFTATSATQTLNFLSIGTPTGLPPMAVLDGVSMAAVPEPATWALMIMGFGLVGGAMRRRGNLRHAAS